MCQKIDLTTIQGGRALRIFDAEMKKVMSNILDTDTNPTAKRKIILTVDFKPDSERKLGVSTVSIRSQLAPVEPHGKNVYFREDENGEFSAFEDDPEQLDEDYKEANGLPHIINGVQITSRKVSND